MLSWPYAVASAAFLAVVSAGVLHFPVLGACLIWLYVAHRDRYPQIRTTVALFTLISLAIQFIPVAPPRMLTSLGFVDLAARYGESVYGAAGAAGANVGADQLSAMPSVHVCWSVLVAWAVITASTSRWRWLILAHPIVQRAHAPRVGFPPWQEPTRQLKSRNCRPSSVTCKPS